VNPIEPYRKAVQQKAVHKGEYYEPSIAPTRLNSHMFEKRKVKHCSEQADEKEQTSQGETCIIKAHFVAVWTSAYFVVATVGMNAAFKRDNPRFNAFLAMRAPIFSLNYLGSIGLVLLIHEFESSTAA